MRKANCLLIGCGGIGTIAALNLERGGLAAVTAVLRSNYSHVVQHGFTIESVDHGNIKGFRPSNVRDTIPNVRDEVLPPFDYIICTTKNIPDVPPTLAELISPAVTPGISSIVLIQNGLNIEKPLIKAFPNNIVISGTSFNESRQTGQGIIAQTDTDRVSFGAFENSNISIPRQQESAKAFCAIYGVNGKCDASYDPNVGWIRWRKLLYNACLNPICAISGLDTGLVQLSEETVANLVVPAMQEIRAVAKACGHDLPEELIAKMISLDRIATHNAPSMLLDVRANRFLEFENLVGEPMRAGLAHGVPIPTLGVLYHILAAMQWKLKVTKGMVQISPVYDSDSEGKSDSML
ncbi:hypothetical protein LTR84_000671 [Exophiala bonariae]|uniref:2-dehydropantoate 2-reductase n=1 Tax=Exophiala bonariae TaxID=1690606 RepID=A0AAV9NUQ3_9EURO|nr:hypothetical protein LTR84_000671 [Exophiala bonariae]